MSRILLEKLASIDAQLRLGKVSEDDKLVEYDALLLDCFLDILQYLHGDEIKETEKMVAMRDEATQSGTPLTAEEMSTSVLGEAKYYIRGLGVGRRPSSLSPNSNSAHQEVLKLQAETELMHEERRIEWEDKKRRDEEQREDQRRRDEEYQSHCDALQRQLEEFEKFKALMMKQMLGQDVRGWS